MSDYQEIDAIKFLAEQLASIELGLLSRDKAMTVLNIVDKRKDSEVVQKAYLMSLEIVSAFRSNEETIMI